MSNINIKSCQRFSNIKEKDIRIDNILIYLNLVKKGCPKQKALNFATKKNCRFDISKKLDGPRNFKVMKINNFNPVISQNGWTYQQPTYKFEKNKFSNPKEILKNDKLLVKINKTMKKNLIPGKKKFNKKINEMDNYYNKKFSIKTFKENNYINKDRKIKINTCNNFKKFNDENFKSYQNLNKGNNIENNENLRFNLNKLLGNYTQYLNSLSNNFTQNNLNNDKGINFLMTKKFMANEFNKSFYIKNKTFSIKKNKFKFNDEIIDNYYNKNIN